MKPIISVLMSVYNSERYLSESIESILNQSFTNFEFIIINDGSTDSSLEIIKSYKDPRICLICNKKNIGLAKSLNIGIKSSCGKYIARMDADDVSFSSRLEKQLDFMEIHLDVGVCGSWSVTFLENKRTLKKVPTQHKQICTMLLSKNSIAHPSVIMRKSIFDNYFIAYDESFSRTQDYKLWADMAKVTKLANIPEVLILRRIHDEQVTNRNKSNRNIDKIQRSLAEGLLGRNLTNKEIAVNKTLYLKKYNDEYFTFEEVTDWLRYLRKENEKKKIYLEEYYNRKIDVLRLKFFLRYLRLQLREDKKKALIMLLDLFRFDKQGYNLHVVEICRTLINYAIFRIIRERELYL